MPRYRIGSAFAPLPASTFCALRLVKVGCPLLLLAASLWGQFSSGIQGTVADRTAAVVPGARVVVTNIATGVSRETTSTDDGVYRVPSLSPGTYKIAASKEGFGTAEQDSVVVGANEIRRVDFTLTVGRLVETVTVSAQATALETEEGRISGQIDQKQMRELPIPNRNVFNLLNLQPGVTGRSLGTDNVGGSSTPQVNANGTRVDNNSFFVDDMNANSISRGGRSEVTPNLETVSEVRVVTNNFSATQGRNMGAQISVTTKSGTNQFHGAVWDYHRNNKFESRGFFAPSVPVSRRNQFGYGLGGPIMRNRTFFYTTYEGLRSSGTNINTATVETPQLLDYVLQTRPNSIAAYVFNKYRPVPGIEMINIRDIGGPRPGVNQFSSTADGIPDLGTLRYFAPTDSKSNQFTMRVDHELRPGKDRVYGYYYWHDGRTITQPVRPDFQRNELTTGNFGNLNWTHTFSPATLNEVRAGVTRWIGRYSDLLNKEVPELVITGFTPTIRDVNVFPGGWSPTEYMLRDQLSTVRGTHRFQVGGELRRAYNILWHTRNFIPAYSFASLLDFIDDEPLQMTRTVDPRTGEPISTRADQQIWEAALFIQDDWKVRRNLTLGFGLRYDYFGPYTDRHNRLRNFVMGPGSSVEQQIASGKMDVVSQGWNTDKLNIAPRFGFAWDIGAQGKNVIRGGWGISYDRMATVYTAGYRENPPLAAQAQLGLQLGLPNFTYTLGKPDQPNFGYPVDPQLRLGLDERNGIRGAKVAIRAIDNNFNNPYAYNWFVGYQRALPGQLVLEASYIGSSGFHLVNITNVNRFNGDLNNNVIDALNPSFSQINFAQTNGNSAYHGATVMVRKQFSRGFSFNANYTYGKVLTESEAEQDVTNFNDVTNRRLDRSLASFNVPHRVALVGVWELPFLRACSAWYCKAAGGWQLSGYGIFEQGRPLNVTSDAAYPNGDWNGDGVRSDRPDAPAESIKRSGFSKQEFLNGIFTAADFPRPALGTVGNLGRNTFQGPGFARIDASLLKRIPLFAERMTADLKLESFNAFNRVNFNPPAGNLTSNNFGRVTSAAEGRTYQASLLIRF